MLASLSPFFIEPIHPNQQRIVIEVDGKQHYANGNEADVNKYAEMVAADRQLRLNGYEIYRFGGSELYQEEKGKEIIENFFQKLLAKHNLINQ